MQLQSSLPVSRGNASLCRAPTHAAARRPERAPSPRPPHCAPRARRPHLPPRRSPARGARRSPQERASRGLGRTPGLPGGGLGAQGVGRLAPAALQPGGRGAPRPHPARPCAAGAASPRAALSSSGSRHGGGSFTSPEHSPPRAPQAPQKMCTDTHTPNFGTGPLSERRDVQPPERQTGSSRPRSPALPPGASEPTWSRSRTGRRRPSSPVGTRRAPSF